MGELVRAIFQLYRQALVSTFSSLTRNWVLVVAIVVLAVLMFIISGIAMSLGMLGGFLLGTANAFAVGTLLSLLEQAVLSTRQITWEDIWNATGQYFWDVITIGFIVWMPLQFLEIGVQSNPYAPLSYTHLTLRTICSV